MECYFWGDSLGEPLRAQKKQQHSYGVLLLFLWLASGYARFAIRSYLRALRALGTARKRAAATIPLARKKKTD
jgi:hypothetical protein